MSDKYERQERKSENPPILPNEVRITALGRRKNYISYAIKKLTEVKTTIYISLTIYLHYCVFLLTDVTVMQVYALLYMPYTFMLTCYICCFLLVYHYLG